MSKIKIGIECESIEGKKSNLPAGRQVWGVGRMLMKLLEELSHRPELENKYRFVLYFKDNIPDLPFLDSPIFEKKKVSVPFFKGRLFPIYYFALLPIKLWFDRPHVMFWPNYMLPIIAFSRSMVMLTEDVYYETHSGKLPFRYRLAYGIFGWWTAKFATRILAISETSKRNLAKLYKISPNRIFINYLGVNLYHDRIINYIKNSPYILYVGQMFPRRHAKETILAFEKLVKEFLPILPPTVLQNRGSSISRPNQNDLEEIGTELKLITVGPDKYEMPIIKRLVSEINSKLGAERVVHKDYVDDDELLSLYSGAKALIYVSDKEAFGLPPMEALSFGVPPIIADNELGHELFGDYAFYAEGSDVGGITEAIRKVLTESEKVQKIKTEGPDFVKRYNWKSFTDKFLEELRQ